MSFPRYPEYKESGIEWLGEIPANWDKSRLGYESWVRARLGWKGLKADEYVDDGYAFLATPNIKDREIDFENVNFITNERFEESPEIKLRVSDVLLAKDGSTLGTVNVVRDLPRPATVNSSIAVITPGESLDSVYLYYLFRSTYMEQTIQEIKGGMGVPHLFQSDLVKFYIPLPGLPEQQAIAAFLDAETAKIDALVAEQQRLIELLKEKRQAVISHAVTKGLNPNVKMKPSGIDWLGDVPEHWEEYPLKALMSLKHGYAFDGAGFSPEGESILMTPGNFLERGGYRPKTTEKYYEGDDIPEEYVLQSGQLLVAMTEQAPGLLGSALFVPDHGVFLHNQRIGLIVGLRRDMLNEKFLFHLFNSIRYRAEVSVTSTGSKVKHTSSQRMLSVKVCLPPLPEQVEIASVVDEKTELIDQLEAEAERTIELLQERRTALISAAVTGQIDVRNVSRGDAGFAEEQP